jgi:hypothetical protein
MKQGFYFFTIVYCIIASTCNAMEKNPFVEIKSEKDIVPFVKNIVAYTTDSYALGKEGGYVLHDNPLIKYGYVEDKGYGNRQMLNVYDEVCTDPYGLLAPLDRYYRLHKLLKMSGDMPYNRYLRDDELKYELLAVRNIDQQEAKEILNAIEDEKARFDWLNHQYDLFAVIVKSLKDKIGK